MTFILVKGGDNKLAIHSNNGSIYVIASIVNDTEFTLTVTAKDKGTPALSTDGVIVIVVEQPNDYTPVFSNLPNQTNIVENSAVPSLLFTAIASDGDSSDTLEGQFSFSIPTSSPYISINSNTGKITLENSFDREEQNTLNFTIRVTDKALRLTKSADATLTVTVLDENDNSPEFDEKVYVKGVAENSTIGTTIVIVSAIDLDEGTNQKLKYFLEPTTDDGFFLLNQETGALSIKKTLHQKTNPVHNLSVVAEDAGSPKLNATAVVKINVIEVNDNSQYVNDNSPVLLPVKFSVASSTFEALPVPALSRITENNYQHDFWMYSAGKRTQSTSFKYSLGPYSDTRSVTPKQETPSDIRAILITKEVWYDSSEVKVALQVRGVGHTTAQVANVRVEARAVASYKSDSTNGQCLTDNTRGSTCVVTLTFPGEWFDHGVVGSNKTVDISYRIATSSNSFTSLGSVSVHQSRKGCNSFKAGVLIIPPWHAVYPNKQFQVKLEGFANYAISTFQVKVTFDKRFAYIGVVKQEAWTITTVLKDQELIVNGILQDTKSVPGIVSSYESLVTLTFSAEKTVPSSGTLLINCSVLYLTNVRKERISPATAHFSNRLDNGECNAAQGKIHVSQDVLVGLFPHAINTNLLNTAYLNEEKIETSLAVVGVYSTGATTATENGVSCTSQDSEVVSVETDCAKAFLDGSESKGKDEAIIDATKGNVKGTALFRVWIPSQVTIRFEDNTLSPVTGWKDPKTCTQAYQQTTVTVEASFEHSSGSLQQTVITDVVKDKLISSDTSVLELIVSPLQVTAKAKTTGFSNVSVSANGRNLGLVKVTTGSDFVDLEDIRLEVVTGIEFNGTLTDPVSGASQRQTTKASIKRELGYVGDKAAVLASAVFKDGSQMSIFKADGLSLISLDTSILEVDGVKNETVIVRGSGKGPILTAQWIDQCDRTEIVEGSYFVDITLRKPDKATVSLGSNTLVVKDDPSTQLKYVDKTSISIKLVYEGGEREIDVTTDSRTIVTVSRLDLITVTGGDVAANSNGPTGNATITVTFAHEAVTVSTTVTVIKSARITAQLRTYTGGSVGTKSVTSFRRYAGTTSPIYQDVQLYTTLDLSSGVKEDISENVQTTYSILSGVLTSTSAKNVFRTTTSGSSTVNVTFETLDTSVTVNVVETPLLKATKLVTTGDGGLRLSGSQPTFSAAKGETSQLSVTATFDDGTVHPNIFDAGKAVFPGFISFVTPSQINSTANGELTLLDNSYSNVEVRINASLGVTETTTFAANLLPALGDVDLGEKEGPPLASASVGDKVQIPVHLNIKGKVLGAVDITVNYPSNLVKALSVTKGKDWPGGIFISSINSLSGAVKFGGSASATSFGTDFWQVAVIDFEVKAAGRAKLTGRVETLSELDDTVKTIGSSVPKDFVAGIVEMDIISRSRKRRSASDSDSLNVVRERTRRATGTNAVRCSTSPCNCSDGRQTGDANGDCIFDINDVTYTSIYIAEAALNFQTSRGQKLKSLQKEQLDGMDADLNGDIDLEDALYLAKVNFGLLRFVTDLTIVRVDDAGSNCSITLSAKLLDKGDVVPVEKETFLFIDIAHKSSVFQQQFSDTALSIGSIVSSTGSRTNLYGGWWQASHVGDGVYRVKSKPGPIEITNIGLSIVIATVDGSGMYSTDRSTQLFGSLVRPFEFSSLDNTLPLIGTSSQKVRVIASQGYNPLKSFDNTIPSTTCFNYHSPVFDKPKYADDFAEFARIGSQLLQVFATDADNGLSGKVRYFIEKDTIYNPGTFSINETTGLITLEKSLDYELTVRYSLVVAAADSGPHVPSRRTTTSTVVVDVSEVNDNTPAFTTAGGYNVTVSEEFAVNGTLVTVVAKDCDRPRLAGDIKINNNNLVSYRIVSGNVQDTFSGVDQFRLGSTNGKLLLNRKLNREVQDFFDLVVEAKDKGTNPGSLSSTVHVWIEVTDTNDNPPIFSQKDYYVDLSENAKVGDVFSTVTVTDTDVGLNGDFNITIYDQEDSKGRINGYFAVNGKPGKISLLKPLDRETETEYTIYLLAYDFGHGLEEDKIPDDAKGFSQLHVTVCDENDHTPYFYGNLYSVSVRENETIGLKIFHVNASDDDAGSSCASRQGDINKELYYSITAGNTGDSFAVGNVTGDITIRSTLDRENTSAYNLTVTAKDLGTPSRSTSTTVKVAILDYNDNAPTITLHTTTYNFSENAQSVLGNGTANAACVVTLTSSDPDLGRNGNVTYELTSGSPNKDDFIVYSNSGKLCVYRPLNRERVRSYVHTVTVRDRGTPSRSSSIQLTLNLDDRNDNYPSFLSTSYSATIDEYTAKGTFVVDVNATDPDEGSNGLVRYKFDSARRTDGNRFEIDPVTGEITVSADTLCLNDDITYTLYVIASDSATPALSTDAKVSITVRDVNIYAPVFPTEYAPTVVDNAPSGTSVVKVAAIDRDSCHDAFEYAILSGNTLNAFAIDSGSGLLTVVGVLDKEVMAAYNLNVSATDRGSVNRLVGYVRVVVVVGEYIPTLFKTAGAGFLEGFVSHTVTGPPHEYSQNISLFNNLAVGVKANIEASVGGKKASYEYTTALQVANAISGVLVSDDAWEDSRDVSVGLQVRSRFHGSGGVAQQTVYVKVVPDAVLISAGVDEVVGSCLTGAADGSCLATATLPKSWFTNITQSASAKVLISLDNSTFSGSAGDVIIHPVQKLPPADGNVVIVLPSRSLFPGQVFDVNVYANARYTVNTFQISCSSDNNVEILATTQFAINKWAVSTFLDGKSKGSWIGHSRSSQDGLMVSNYQDLITIKAKVSTTTTVHTGNFQCKVNKLSNIYDNNVFYGTAHHIYRDVQQNGSGNGNSSLVGVLYFQQNSIRGLFPYSDYSELINLAVLTGETFSFKLTLSSLNTQGRFVVPTSAVTCSSNDRDILKVERDCSAVYFDGSETDGGSADVTVVSGVLTGVLSFNVKYPKNVRISVSDTELSIVNNWLVPPNCDHPWQEATVDVFATFTDQVVTSTEVQITDIVASFLSSSQSNVAVVSNGIVKPVQVGTTTVDLVLRNGATIKSSDVLVVEDSVDVVAMNVYAVKSVEIKSVVAGTGVPLNNKFPVDVVARATASVSQTLSYYDEVAEVVAAAVTNDGRRLELSSAVGAILEATNTSVISVKSGLEFETAGADCTGNLLKVTWKTSCSPTVIATGSGFINVKLDLRPDVIIELDNDVITPLSDASVANGLSFPTSAILKVILSYKDGNGKELRRSDVTVDPRTNYDLSQVKSLFSVRKVGSVYQITPNVSAGRADIVVSFSHLKSTAIRTVTVVRSSDITVVAHPYPPYEGSNSVNIGVLNKYGKTVYHREAELAVNLQLSDGNGAIVKEFDISRNIKTTFIVSDPQTSFKRVTDVILIGGNGKDHNHVQRAVPSYKEDLLVYVDAEFGGVQSSQPWNMSVSDEPLYSVSIDAIDLSSGGNVVAGVAGTKSDQIKVWVTFNDNTKVQLFDNSGKALVPGFVFFGNNRGSSVRIDNDGGLTPLSNAEEEFDISVSLHQTAISGDFETFSVNLLPDTGDVDLGKSDGVAIPPVTTGEEFTVPVRINTGNSSLGAFDISVFYNSTYLKPMKVELTKGWPGGVLRWRHDQSLNTIRFYGVSGTDAPSSPGLDVFDITFIALAAGVTRLGGNVNTLVGREYNQPSIGNGGVFVAGDVPIKITQHPRQIPSGNLSPSPLQSGNRLISRCTDTLPCPCLSGSETGDSNGDCVFDILDVLRTAQHVSSGLSGFPGTSGARLLNYYAYLEREMDANEDGVIDWDDVNYLTAVLNGDLYFIRDVHLISVQDNSPVCRLEINVTVFAAGDIPVDDAHTSVFVGIVSHGKDILNQWQRSQLDLGRELKPSLHHGGIDETQLLRPGLFAIQSVSEVKQDSIGVFVVLATRDANGKGGPDRTYVLFGRASDIAEYPDPVDVTVDSSAGLSVRIVASSGFNPLLSFAQTLTTVECKNDHPPSFYPDTLTLEVSEAEAPGSVIVQLYANDSDTGINATLIYSLETLAPHSGPFAINSSTGVITLTAPLDRETNGLYILKASAIDGGVFYSLAGHADITVTVTDINDNDPVFSQSVYRSQAVLESQPIGDVVEVVSATDEDSGRNAEITYSLEWPTEFFAIDSSTGEISVARSLDYENTTSYVVYVIATDGGVLSRNDSAVVLITVLPFNDHTPICLPSVIVQQIAEEEANGSVVATVTATDDDIGLDHDNIRFTIVPGHDGQGKFDLTQTSNTTADVFVKNGQFSRDIGLSYNLLIQAIDSGGLACNVSVTLNVLEPSTFDFSIKNVGFLTGSVGVQGVTTFVQDFGLLSDQVPGSRGSIVATLGSQEETATFTTLLNLPSHLQKVILTDELWPGDDVGATFAVTVRLFDSSYSTKIDKTSLRLRAISPVSGDFVDGRLCIATASSNGLCQDTVGHGPLQVRIPDSWFDLYDNASIQILPAFSTNSIIGQVRLNRRLNWQDNMSADNLSLEVPSRPLFIGETFEVKVYGFTPYKVKTTDFKIQVDSGNLKISNILAVDLSCTQTAKTNEISVSCSLPAAVTPPTTQRTTPEYLLSVRVTVNGGNDETVTVTGTGLSLSDTTKDTIFTDVNKAFEHVDRYGHHKGSPAFARVKIGPNPAPLVGILPYTERSELINTPAINSIKVESPITVSGVYRDYLLTGRVTGIQGIKDLKSSLICSVINNNIVNVESDCSSAYLDGNQANAGETQVRVSYAPLNLTQPLSYRVWAPRLPLTLSVSDATLSPVTLWLKPPLCKSTRFQQARINVEAAFTDGLGQSISVHVKDKIGDSQFVSSNPAVAVINKGFVEGVSPGDLSISVQRGNSVLGTVSLTVDATPVQVSSLNAFVFASLNLSIQPSTNISSSAQPSALVTIDQQFYQENQAVHVAAHAVFSDGAQLEIKAADGLYVNSTNVDVVQPIGQDQLRSYRNGEGYLVPTYWWPAECRNVGQHQQVLSSTEGYVKVDIPPPTDVIVTVGSGRVFEANSDLGNLPFTISGLSSYIDVTVQLKFKTYSQNLTTDSRTIYNLSLSNDLFFLDSSNGRRRLTANSNGKTGNGFLVVQFKHVAITKKVRLTVVDIDDLIIRVRPYPTFPGFSGSPSSSIIDEVSLDYIAGTGIRQKAQLFTHAALTDRETFIDISQSATYSISDSSTGVTTTVVTLNQNNLVLTPSLKLQDARDVNVNVAFYSHNSSKTVVVTVSNKTVTVDRVDTLQFEKSVYNSGTLFGEVGTSTQLDVDVTLSDQTRLLSVFHAGTYAGLVTIGSDYPAAINVSRNGLATLQGNHYKHVILTASAVYGNSSAIPITRSVAANLDPAKGDMDVGKQRGIPVSAVSSVGSSFSVDVWVNTGAIKLGALELAIDIDDSVLQATKVDNFRDGAFVARINDPPSKVSFGGSATATGGSTVNIIKVATVEFRVLKAAVTYLRGKVVTIGEQGTTNNVASVDLSVAGYVKVAVGGATRRRRDSVWSDIISTSHHRQERAVCSRGDTNADGVFNTFDIDEALMYVSRRNSDPNLVSGYTDDQERELDANLDGFIDSNDAYFLTQAYFGLIRFLTNITVVPVSATNDNCTLTIIVTMEGRGCVPASDAQTLPFILVSHHDQKMSAEWSQSQLQVGYKSVQIPASTLQVPSIPYGGFWELQPEGGTGRFRAEVKTPISSKGIGLNLVQYTVDQLKETDVSRLKVMVANVSRTPFDYSAVQGVTLTSTRLQGVAAVNVPVGATGYNPLSTFDNTLRSDFCEFANVRYNRSVYSIYVSEDTPIGNVVTDLSKFIENPSFPPGLETYKIVAGNTNGDFDIPDLASGEVVINNTLNREITQLYSLVILVDLFAEDFGSPKLNATAVVKISVIEVNDNSPVVSDVCPDIYVD